MWAAVKYDCGRRVLAVKMNLHDICMFLFLCHPQENELSYKDWHISETFRGRVFQSELTHSLSQ